MSAAKTRRDRRACGELWRELSNSDRWRVSSEVHVIADLHIADRAGMEDTGVGRYAVESVRALCAARPDWRITVLGNRPQLVTCPNATCLSTTWPTERSAVRVAWLHSQARRDTRTLRADVWLGTAFTLPVWWRGVSLVTVHDLVFLEMPGAYSSRLRAGYASRATRWASAHADRIICGSKDTARRLESHFGVPPSRINVLAYGVSDAFFTERTAGPAATPYLLFVGTFEARKGLDVLHHALAILAAERGRDVRLTLAGRPGWGTEGTLAALERDKRVEIHLGPTDDELAALYRGALALVYPSRSEGFGLPVAEAMAAGTPVIATTLDAIREFAGDVPLYTRVGDAAGIADRVEQLLDQPDAARVRALRGRPVAATLRWSTLGIRTAELIEEVLA